MEFEYFYFVLIHLELKRNHTRYQTKMSKIHTRFQTWPLGGNDVIIT